MLELVRGLRAFPIKLQNKYELELLYIVICKHIVDIVQFQFVFVPYVSVWFLPLETITESLSGVAIA